MIAGALALIPGAGPIVALLYKLGGVILRCTPCLIALAICGAWIHGDIHGHRKADAKCAAADLAMQLKAAQRDVDAKADAAKFAQAQVDVLSQENAKLNQKVADYAKFPHAACPLGARADKLRAIAPGKS